MYITLNEKILREKPTTEQIIDAFESLNNSKDIITIHKDNGNYIEAKRFAFGGYELKHSIDNNILISELDCIKEEIVKNIFSQYNSGNDNATKVLKWKKQGEHSSIKKIKNIGLIILIAILLFLRLNGKVINEKVLTSLENGGVNPLLFFAFILLIMMAIEWKHLENYKIIEGHKKFYATMPPILLFMVIIVWVRSLF